MRAMLLVYPLADFIVVRIHDFISIVLDLMTCWYFTSEQSWIVHPALRLILLQQRLMRGGIKTSPQ